MPASLRNIQVFIDGQVGIGDLSIENEVQTEHTLAPKIDPNWTFIDSAGHFHAYDADEKLPTLTVESERMPCSCETCGGEGYYVIHRHCLICREEITPGTIAGPHEVTIGLRRSWSVKAKLATLPSAERVSVRFEGAPTLFGVATVRGSGFSHSDMVDVELTGEGPLSRMAGPKGR